MRLFKNTQCEQKLYDSLKVFNKQDLQTKIETVDLYKPLKLICDQISEALDILGGSCFFKMSTRSAKDVVFEQPNEVVLKQLGRALEEYADEHTTESPTETDRSAAAYHALQSFIRIGTMAFKKETALDVLWDLFCSKRCLPDISRVLALHDSKSSNANYTKMEIILRQWIDLPQTSEFRVFYRSGKVRAISQYDHLIYNPEILNKKSCLITSIIKTFIDNIITPQVGVRDGIGIDSFIADIAIVNIEDISLSPETAEITLIELNPYLSITSACLFDWKTDLVLTIDSSEIESRYVSGPVNALEAVRQLAPCYRSKIGEWLDYFF